MLTASPSTYCGPTIVNRTLALLDRMAAEDLAWLRTPRCMRRPGYFSGHDAVLVSRRGVIEPVALCDLTSAELDALLSVPAAEMACAVEGGL